MTRQAPAKYAEALSQNAAAIAKAERYVEQLKAQGIRTTKFNKLADQAVAWNDFRVLEMVYSWAEFECRRYGN